MEKETETGFARKLRRQQTDAEKNLWSRLRNQQLGIKFRRQEIIGNYIVDFVAYDKKIIVELDGSQHDEISVKRKDDIRTNWLGDKGFKVLRFWDNDVLVNIDGVLAIISESIR
jgi:very-short-patch-repair endonuclease